MTPGESVALLGQRHEVRVDSALPQLEVPCAGALVNHVVALSGEGSRTRPLPLIHRDGLRLGGANSESGAAWRRPRRVGISPLDFPLGDAAHVGTGIFGESQSRRGAAGTRKVRTSVVANIVSSELSGVQYQGAQKDFLTAHLGRAPGRAVSVARVEGA